MNKAVIKVENLGKLYRLGEIGTGTISHDLNRWWARIRGKEDPFAKIGQTNDRTIKANNDYVWALKDISFHVKQGEVLGIIGRNGAGKSTLLKILSKVTTPSAGRIKINGRIASLLEVGTGFHPELTGRENVFLNGAILGMTKVEIRSKFDAIVDFAGVEKYIDTPVKRYSSGMYVRLAFAVAAFLEPEILIIDEVLAVGDAEFQKKCLGRMQDVSKNDGRTVLFVSHNMSSIKTLCNKAVFLKNGLLHGYGETSEMITEYFNQNIQTNKASEYIEININNEQNKWRVNETILINLKFPDHFANSYIDLTFYDNTGTRLFSFHGTRNNRVKVQDIDSIKIKNPGIVNTSISVDMGLKADEFDNYFFLERNAFLLETEFKEENEIVVGNLIPTYEIIKR